MFRTAGYPGAGARYRSIDMASRVEGASPHRLVAILFEELLQAIEAIQAAQRLGDTKRSGEREARAISLLHALETSLDHDRGGDIAANLAAVYREVRRLIGIGGRQGESQTISQAHAMIADIAGAWAGIA